MGSCGNATATLLSLPSHRERPQSLAAEQTRVKDLLRDHYGGDNKTSKTLALCRNWGNVNKITLLCDSLPLSGFLFQVLGFYEQLPRRRTAQGVSLMGSVSPSLRYEIIPYTAVASGQQLWALHPHRLAGLALSLTPFGRLPLTSTRDCVCSEMSNSPCLQTRTNVSSLKL